MWITMAQLDTTPQFSGFPTRNALSECCGRLASKTSRSSLVRPTLPSVQVLRQAHPQRSPIRARLLGRSRDGTTRLMLLQLAQRLAEQLSPGPRRGLRLRSLIEKGRPAALRAVAGQHGPDIEGTPRWVGSDHPEMLVAGHSHRFAFIGTPPPKSDEAVRAAIETDPWLTDWARDRGMTMATLRVTPFSVRCELWRVIQELLQEISDAYRVPFVPVPDGMFRDGALS